MDFLHRSEFYTVLVYLVLMVGIGIFLLRRNKGGTDYFAGGRCVPWWVSGVSLYMGNFSAWLFTGGASFIYRTTWYGIVYFLLTGTVAYFLGSQLTAVLWRRSRVISPVEFTRRRFGVGTQQILGVVTVVVFLAAAGNQLKAIATVVNGILGIPLAEGAIVIGIIVIVYTIIGGLWAVVVTDVVQLVVLLAATLLVAPLALTLLGGGLGEMFASMKFEVPPADGQPWHNLHFLVAGLISLTLGVASGQGPRFYCVPEERSARKVGILAAALFLTTPILFSLPALVARSHWGGPAALAATFPGGPADEQVFVRIAMEVLPPGLLGVFLAAMFAATMSALDTVYNLVASILSKDMYMHFRPETSDRRLIGVGRVMTVFAGLITIDLCLFYVGGTVGLFDVMMTILYTSSPVMAVPVLMGFLYRRAPRSAGMAAIIWGIATSLVTKVVLGWDTGPQVYVTFSMSIGIFLVSPWLGEMWRSRDGLWTVLILAIVFAALVLGVMLLGSPENSDVGGGFTAHEVVAAYVLFIFATLLCFARWFAQPEDRSEVDRFYEDLDRPVDVATEVTGSEEAALSIFRLVGVVTLVIAVGVAALMAIELVARPDLRDQWWKYAAMTGILVALAALFYLPGRLAAEIADAD